MHPPILHYPKLDYWITLKLSHFNNNWCVCIYIYIYILSTFLAQLIKSSTLARAYSTLLLGVWNGEYSYLPFFFGVTAELFSLYGTKL